jgi:hypothetical protein
LIFAFAAALAFCLARTAGEGFRGLVAPMVHSSGDKPDLRRAWAAERSARVANGSRAGQNGCFAGDLAGFRPCGTLSDFLQARDRPWSFLTNVVAAQEGCPFFVHNLGLNMVPRSTFTLQSPVLCAR